MEKKDLLEALNSLKAGYISALNALDVMKNWGKVQLEALYSTKIGRYKIELLDLQIRYRAVKKKIQLCHQYINRNQNPDFLVIEETVRQMSAGAYKEIHAEKQKLAFGKAVLSNLKSPEDSAEIRKIYRNIARTLHPDINPNLSEKQRELWHTFQKAYKDGDLDRLKAMEIVFADELQQSAQQLKDLPEEEILLQTAQIKQGIAVLEQQIAELEKEFPFNIADLIRDEDWVKEQQETLKKEIAEAQQALKEKEDIYQLLRETYE